MWPATRSPASSSPDRALFASLGAGVASLAVLIWMIVAGPGYLGHGAALLWTGRTTQTLPRSTIFASAPATPRPPQHRPDSSPRRFGRPADRAGSPLRPLLKAPRSGNKSPCSRSRAVPASSFFCGLARGRRVLRRGRAAALAAFQHARGDLPAVKQIKVTYHFPSWTGHAQTPWKSMAAICAPSKARMLIWKSPRTGRCETACWLVDDNSKLKLLAAARATSTQGTVQMEKDGHVPRRRPGSGPDRAPLRRLLHRGPQGQSARSAHHPPGARLSRQPHRRGHHRRAAPATNSASSESRSALFGQRRPGTRS